MEGIRILVTGFSPFGGERVNPAWEAVKRLPRQIGAAEVSVLELPTSFARAAAALEEALEAQRPDAVLSVGQAGGRAVVTVERVAIGLADASIPDNDGAQPVDAPIRADGPAAYFSTLPVKAMVQRIRDAGIPCQLSYTAGTYVCNAVMYQALYLAQYRFPGLRAGFIHVPYSEEQAAAKHGAVPSMALGTMVRALEQAVRAIAEDHEDVQVPMGTLF